MSRHRLLPILLALLLAVPAGLALAPEAAAGASSRRDAALARMVRTRRLQQVAFEEVTLPDLARWLRTATGFNVVLKRVALARAGIEPEDVVFTATLDDVTIHTLLELALEPHELAYQVKDNVIWITTDAEAMGRPLTRLYGISHITWQKVDFIAPDINLRPSNFVPVEEHEPERLVEDDPLASGDEVAELLQEIVAPGKWDTEGWSIRATQRYLVVRAPMAVHARIPDALDVIASMK